MHLFDATFFGRIHRARLFFDTPNELAVTLVAAWGMFLYFISINREKINNAIAPSSRFQPVCHASAFMLMTILLVCLVATYSRSGMVAMVVIACALWRSRGARKGIIASLIVCALCLVILPGAGERFTQIAPLADKSITHRFDVWRGTLGMSLDRPWAGFGVSNFGRMLTTWYLPPGGSNAIYMTAVNTPLTILGFWGYPALFAYAWIWMLLIITGIRALCRENKGATVCFIVQLAFLTGAFFAELHQSIILNTLLLASLGGSVFFLSRDGRARKAFCRRWLATAAAASAVTCGLIYAIAFLFFSEGYCLRNFAVNTHGKSTGQGWLLVPKKSNGSRLAWIVSSDKVREHARSLCRPLAGQGWEVIMLEPGAGEILNSEAGMMFLQYAASLLSTKPAQCLAGGIGEDGLAALALAAKLRENGETMSKTVVVNIESYWPFAEFNPQNTIKTAGGPVILAYGNSGAYYSQPATILIDMGRKAGRQIELLPLNAFVEKDMLVSLGMYFSGKTALRDMLRTADGTPGKCEL